MGVPPSFSPLPFIKFQSPVVTHGLSKKPPYSPLTPKIVSFWLCLEAHKWRTTFMGPLANQDRRAAITFLFENTTSSSTLSFYINAKPPTFPTRSTQNKFSYASLFLIFSNFGDLILVFDKNKYPNKCHERDPLGSSLFGFTGTLTIPSNGASWWIKGS